MRPASGSARSRRSPTRWPTICRRRRPRAAARAAGAASARRRARRRASPSRSSRRTGRSRRPTSRSGKPPRLPRRNAGRQPETAPIAHGRALPDPAPDRLRGGDRDRGLAVRVPRAADPVRGRRERRPAAALRDHRRARHELRPLHLPQDFLRNLSIGLLFLVAASLVFPQVGVWIERPLARLSRRSPDSDLGGGFLLGASLGLVFVPCGGPIIGAISANAARVHLGWQTVAITIAYALGAALPMLAIAALGQRATRRI